MQERLDWMIGQNIGHRLFRVVAEGRERALAGWGGADRAKKGLTGQLTSIRMGALSSLAVII